MFPPCFYAALNWVWRRSDSSQARPHKLREEGSSISVRSDPFPTNQILTLSSPVNELIFPHTID